MRKRWWQIALGVGMLALAAGGVAWWLEDNWTKVIATERFFKADAPANTTVATADMPFVFLDRTGKRVDLNDYKGKYVVLVVVRGLQTDRRGDFCQFCVGQTSSLMVNHRQFKKRGAEVVLVFPGTADDVALFTRRAADEADTSGDPPFPVVLDQDLAAVDKLGIRNTRDPKAKPSTYILDKDGNVVYGYVGASISDRPSVAALLAQLDKLGAG